MDQQGILEPLSKSQDDRLPAVKKPEPFLICVNELKRSDPSWTKNNLVEIKEKKKIRDRNNESSVRTRMSGISFKFSSGSQTEDDDPSKTSVDDSSSIMSKGQSSIRSKAGTIASTGSSFVEIVLSTCCSTYSSAFNGSDPSPTTNTKPNRGPRSMNPSSWKRFSSHSAGSSHLDRHHPPNSTTRRRSKLTSNPSQLVSNLFSKKLQLV